MQKNNVNIDGVLQEIVNSIEANILVSISGIMLYRLIIVCFSGILNFHFKAITNYSINLSITQSCYSTLECQYSFTHELKK